MNRKEKIIVRLLSLVFGLVVVGLVVGLVIAVAHLHHSMGHPPWFQSVVNWMTIPFKYVFLLVAGVAVGIWLSPHEWINLFLGIPTPTDMAEKAEEYFTRKHRKHRISQGLTLADIDEMDRRLESVANEYNLTLAQVCKVIFEPMDTQTSPDL